MTTRKNMQYVPAALLAALFCAACGAAKPSTELVNARNAYTRARTGEAAQLNPSGVHDAYKALQAAEAVHADDAGSAAEKHYAYIATRRSELAISRASEELARREQQRADQTYQTSLERQSEQAAQQSSQYAQQLNQTQEQLQQRSETVEEQQRRIEQVQQAAERARAELEQMQAMREEAGRMIINLSGVLFQTGQAELTPLAKQRLETVAQALAAYPDRAIVIEGHTDAQGDEEKNRQLSLQRADAVRSYLTQRGVPPDRMHVYGRGESEPVASNDTVEGRANNRRVEIVIERAGVALGDQQRQNAAGQDPERERLNTSGRDEGDTQRTPPRRTPPAQAPGGAGQPSPGQGGPSSPNPGQSGGGTTPAQPSAPPSPNQ